MIGAPRVATQLGATARPVQLVVDTVASPPVLLVADANLPMIHRLVLDDAGADPALLPALAPAVPTREVVITPPVPTAVGERAATQRYLYAIDALDNSVLAMDYTDTSVNFGAVLAVNIIAPLYMIVGALGRPVGVAAGNAADQRPRARVDEMIGMVWLMGRVAHGFTLSFKTTDHPGSRSPDRPDFRDNLLNCRYLGQLPPA